MSALNVTPAQAFILAECLGARAQHFRSSMGFVPDELLDLIVELDVHIQIPRYVIEDLEKVRVQIRDQITEVPIVNPN